MFGHLDFKIVVEPADAPAFTVVLLAPSRQEKAAWTSDISQVKKAKQTILYLTPFYIYLRINTLVKGCANFQLDISFNTSPAPLIREIVKFAGS